MTFIEKAAKKGITPDRLVPLKMYTYAEHAQRLEEQERDNPTQPLKTGAPGLDAITGGFFPGELIIISGPTKNGKTCVAQTMSWHMGHAGKRVLWFTMEMSSDELTKKFREMDATYQTTKKYSQAPIAYPIEHHKGDLSLDWMHEAILLAQQSGPVDAVFIDHLHFLLPLQDSKQNVSFIVGAIVREVKHLARNLNLPIFLIAHTTKLSTDEVPDLSSLRDSSFIAQESDYVLMIYRLKNKARTKATHIDDLTPVYSDNACLSVEANRRSGRTGKIKLHWNGRMFVEPYVPTDPRDPKPLSPELKAMGFSD